MNYDKILLELGEFGPWQRTNTFLLGIPFFVAGMNIILTSFTVMEPRNGFRCKIMQCDGPNFKGDFSAEVWIQTTRNTIIQSIQSIVRLISIIKLKESAFSIIPL